MTALLYPSKCVVKNDPEAQMIKKLLSLDDFLHFNRYGYLAIQIFSILWFERL